jgi:ferric-dicitrate binding protein FerR (iron transport regulator)
LASLVFVAAGFAVSRFGIRQWGGARERLAASTYTTNNGQRATITLVDGTTVVLGVASRLEVPADYAGGNRTVRLRGEALFTTAHRTAVPFTVLDGIAKTQVLGTVFAVRHYPTDTVTAVAVREGRVTVNGEIVSASRMAEVSRAGRPRVKAIDGSPFTFANGVMTLDFQPLRAAIPSLNRWYDADVRVSDPSIGAHMIAGRFAAGAISDLAEVLQEMLDVRVARNGRVLTLYPLHPQGQ